MISVTIEAHSEQIVKCVADNSFRGKTVLFPASGLEYPVFSAYSIGECYVNGEFYQRVLNPSSDVVVVTTLLLRQYQVRFHKYQFYFVI